MRFLLTAAALGVLAGCASSNPPSPTASPAQVAACWQQAGLEGDLYKVYRPERFGKLTSAGDASQAQIDTFTACVGFAV